MVPWWYKTEDVGQTVVGLTPVRSLLLNDSEQVVHTCASVTKQYNLVLAKGQ